MEKGEKSTTPNTMVNPDSIPNSFLDDICYGELCGSFCALCTEACKRGDTYSKVKEDILKSRDEVKEMIRGCSVPSRQTEWGQFWDLLVPTKRVKSTNKVVVESRCSLCKQIGHTKPRCPNVAILREDNTGASNEFMGHEAPEGHFFESRSVLVRVYVNMVRLYLHN